MTIRHVRWVCLALFALLPASPLRAQIRVPTENTIEDLQFFAPVDESNFGEKPYLNKGFFFSYEHLMWSVQRPDVALVGAFGAQSQTFDVITRARFMEVNAIETSDFQDQLHEGSRIEVGHMGECNGWRFRSTDLHEHLQRFVFSNAGVIFESPVGILGGTFVPVINNITGLPEPFVFDADIDGDGNFGRFGRDTGSPFDPDGAAGPLPPFIVPPAVQITQTTIVGTIPPSTVTTILFIGSLNGIPDTDPTGSGTMIDLDDLVAFTPDFDDLVVTNTTDTWGLDLIGMHRVQRFVLGGHLDLLGGVRFISFGEQFRLEGRLGLLGDTNLFNEAENNILGPTVGFRWFKSLPYCRFSLEGQFMPGLNAQAVRLRSTIDDGLLGSGGAGLTFQNSSNDAFHAYEFAPVGELTASVSVQLTRAISLKAGWTGMYIDHLARPSNMLLYRIPEPEIIERNNRDNAFMQGAHVGIEINR